MCMLAFLRLYYILFIPVGPVPLFDQLVCSHIFISHKIVIMPKIIVHKNTKQPSLLPPALKPKKGKNRCTTPFRKGYRKADICAAIHLEVVSQYVVYCIPAYEL